MKKKIALIATLFLFVCACTIAASNARDDETKAKKYSEAEIILSDFSKKITGYYDGRNEAIPDDFDAKQFIAILKQIYPNKDKVILVENNYKISVRHINGGYSVMLCDPNKGNKLMEDIATPACSLSKVEIRYWDKDEVHPCAFEDNWMSYCK